ncbi:hypothetical protein [Candidatus Odyssella thessalonicensis]|uniref:hypothetical protein n=1 Tax=Candidatus Odyssella thessalonicensis TaxID=84647 RepID=UPI000225B470|nr:hypothetical protein [Candidatus Odyssella thessalonicensis]
MNNISKITSVLVLTTLLNSSTLGSEIGSEIGSAEAGAEQILLHATEEFSKKSLDDPRQLRAFVQEIFDDNNILSSSALAREVYKLMQAQQPPARSALPSMQAPVPQRNYRPVPTGAASQSINPFLSELSARLHARSQTGRVNPNVQLEMEEQSYRLAKKLAAEEQKQLQMFKDEQLARSLADMTLHPREDISNDFAVAAALAQTMVEEIAFGSGGGGEYSIPALKVPLSSRDQQILNQAVAAVQELKMDLDVHGMTRTFARNHYPAMRELEQKYLGITSHRTIGLEGIISQINKFLDKNEGLAPYKVAIASILSKIRIYWQTPIDGETGVNLQELFSNTFLVAERYGDAALTILSIILADNLNTNGGCHPGVAGRLAYLYFLFVNAGLNDKK